MKHIFFGLFILIFCNHMSASDTIKYEHKYQQKFKRFYFYWGYNRAVFAKSDLHIKGPDYDFTLYDVSAADRPSAVSSVYIKPSTITIPQYNYRIGYNVNRRFCISLGMDHMKYVIRNHQNLKISGFINENSSTKFAGQYNNDTITVNNDFLQFEHTDGLNNLSIDFEYAFWNIPLLQNRMRVKMISSIGGLGVIPRTDVTLFGNRVNNKFHFAGFSVNAKLAARIEYKSYLFLESNLRTGYMSLDDILINSAEPRASQNIKFLEYYVFIGSYF